MMERVRRGDIPSCGICEWSWLWVKIRMGGEYRLINYLKDMSNIGVLQEKTVGIPLNYSYIWGYRKKKSLIILSNNMFVYSGNMVVLVTSGVEYTKLWYLLLIKIF
jgi:hypothetical protein